MSDTFVVVGGDAAGMSAASKAKRADPELDVVVFEKGGWVSYAACGMPYYVKGEVEDIADLVTVTPEEFREKRDIDLRTGHEVVGIDPEAETVTVKRDGETVDQPYDHLLVATGANAIEPPFDGLDLDGVFTIHDMDDADAIENYVTEHSPGSAAIVGGGYVGIEMVEALSAHGVEVHLREQGVQLHLDTAVSGFEGGERVRRVALDDESHPAEVAIVGVGVEAEADLAADAGIEPRKTGAITTDEYGRTNYESIYAAGDCAEARHVVTGEPDHVPLALTASRGGRAIGQTVVGDPEPGGEIAGTAIVKAFEIGAARTGILDEERAQKAGFDPVSVTITAPTRAHYYPGGAELTVTLVADRDSGRLLGGSVVGQEGAKRVDTVATALTAGMTVTELRNADLAYAPPFSPVWDPILTAAKVLEGELAGE